METQDLVKLIGNLTVLELSQLTSALEKEFNVTAAAPTIIQAASVEEVKAVEQSVFTVYLVSFKEKLPAVKAVRAILSTLGLKEAMDLINSAPCVIKADVDKAYAQEIVTNLSNAGCTAEMK